MLKPLKQWYCDVCGDIIQKPGDGYVLWKRDEKFSDYDFKIVHKKTCEDITKHPSMSLEIFLGEDGVQYLLTFLSIGKIKKNIGQSSKWSVKDMDEFVDFFRRVQTPYYEEARTKFGVAQLLNDLFTENETGPYLEGQLKNIAEKY
jgi:hypothetical protein